MPVAKDERVSGAPTITLYDQRRLTVEVQNTKLARIYGEVPGMEGG